LLVLIVLIPLVRKRRHLKPRSILIVKLELFIIYANKLSHSPRLNYEIVAIGKSLQSANRGNRKKRQAKKVANHTTDSSFRTQFPWLRRNTDHDS